MKMIYLLFCCSIASLVFAEETKSPEAPAPAKNLSSSIPSYTEIADLTGTSIWEGKETSVKAERGQASVVIFLGTWCIDCQNLLDKIQVLDRIFRSKNIDFSYVFSNDIREDALGFSKEFGISPQANALLADKEVKKNFKYPVAPSIFISDKNRFLAKRFSPMKPEDLPKLEEKLWQLTAI